MKRTKFKITIFALALVLICSVAAFFAVNFKPASAASGVSVNGSGGSNVFTATGDDTEVVVDGQGEEGNMKYYTMFTFGDNDGTVSLRKNVAYYWFQSKTEGEGDDAKKVPDKNYFNMEIGFKEVNFEKFVITFESQQHAKTEDGKTVNYIMFFPAGEKVRVLITDDKDKQVEDTAPALNADHISINFTAKLEGGKYSVTVKDEDNHKVDGTMENVGGNYAKYSSSTTTPVYPLIFNAELKEDGDGKTEDVAKMVLYRLNNQKFEVTDSPRKEGDHYVGGRVTDDTPAVLCLNTEISHLNIGGSVKFDYQVIDVLRTSPSSILYFHVLTYEDTTKTDIDFNDYENTKTDEKDGMFVKVDSNTLLASDREFYLPALGKDGGAGFGKDFKIDMAVKVYAELTDTSSSGEKDYVFLDWYLKDDLKLNINGADFIAVGDDKTGVSYSYTQDEDGVESTEWKQICDAYQAEVTKAAANLYAGSLNYFYLPSAESLFSDNTTAYSDMKISVYYYIDSQSQNTSLAANNLSINVTKPDTYVFTLYATDAASNKMYYLDEDGEPVEFASSDIWKMYADDEKSGYLPWFSFKVDYKGVEFKEQLDKQSTAYVGKDYKLDTDFKINGVENRFTTTYRLFLFDRTKYYADTGNALTYEEFFEKMDELFDSGRHTYFWEIKEVNESDEDYDTYKDYKWSASSTSFVPQDDNAFYYMRAEVKDTSYITDVKSSSVAIVASEEWKALKGDSEWLKNNVASIVLLSVAGVSLIAIILLLVIKPKNKEDIDVQFEQEKSKKKKNK